MDLQSQVAIGDFPVWLDLSLFPCLLLGSAASGQESERCASGKKLVKIMPRGKSSARKPTNPPS
jgi:hypothetical protein